MYELIESAVVRHAVSESVSGVREPLYSHVEDPITSGCSRHHRQAYRSRVVVGRPTGPPAPRRDRLIAVIDRVGDPPTFHVKHGDCSE